MGSEYDDYYTYQVGTGLTAYEGHQFQHGHNWFGSVFSALKPFLLSGAKYLGKQVLGAGARIGEDMIEGNNFNTSLKKNLKITGNKIIEDGWNKAQKIMQSGEGRRRRRRRPRRKKLNLKVKPKRRTSNKKKSPRSKHRKQKKKKNNRQVKLKKKSNKRYIACNKFF